MNQAVWCLISHGLSVIRSGFIVASLKVVRKTMDFSGAHVPGMWKLRDSQCLRTCRFQSKPHIQFVCQILLDFTRKLQRTRQFVTCFFWTKIVCISVLSSNCRGRILCSQGWKYALQQKYDFCQFRDGQTVCNCKSQGTFPPRFTSRANPLTLSNLANRSRQRARGMRLRLMDRMTAK